MFTAIKATFAKKGKFTLILGAILALYIIGVAVWGAFGELINADNFFGMLGTASPIIGALMMIMASLLFSSDDTKQFLGRLLDNGTNRVMVFFSQIIYLFFAYVFFMVISAGLTIILQLTLFGGKSMGSFTKFNMAIYSNMLHMFILCAMIIFFMQIFNRIKDRLTAVAVGIGINYVGLAIAWIGFLFVYHHRLLKWEPFNFLMVENQLIKPINHTLTKLYMNQAITGSIIYGVIFTILALCLFLFRNPIKR
ncbi:hypothetical protein ACYATM_00375 [Lactobacillaceae bacterium Scapto_B20]